jgi:hypothetical protein
MMSHFYLYHEGQGEGEPNEICSLLLDYITNHVSETVKELQFESEICTGQMKNHTVIRFLTTLVANGRFNIIFQYHPVTDFELIKKVLHKIKKGVYTKRVS